MAGKRRRRKSKTDEHLYLRNGVWWTRFTVNGDDKRETTSCPKSEIATARLIRNERLARLALRAEGVEQIPDPKAIGALVEMYLAAESQPYPEGQRGMQRDGFKRSSANDRLYRDRLFAAGLDRNLNSALVDEERLVDVVVQREKQDAAPLTIRNDFRFLARVFNWARGNKRKTGVRTSPFDGLDKKIRRRLFPRAVKGKIRPFRREELIKLCELLPAYAYRPVRIAAHTGLRKEEALSLRWGQVDLEGRRLRIPPDVSKTFTEREVPLNDVALEMLTRMRPVEAQPGDPVFLNDAGGQLKDLRGSLSAAAKKACEPPLLGQRQPTFHSLRKTCATALEAVASKAIAALVLGHSAGDVTDLYIQPSFGDALDALNRAARLIDGELTENVANFPGANAVGTGMAHQTAQRSIS